jgi:hypothetical protein
VLDARARRAGAEAMRAMRAVFEFLLWLEVLVVMAVKAQTRRAADDGVSTSARRACTDAAEQARAQRAEADAVADLCGTSGNIPGDQKMER